MPDRTTDPRPWPDLLDDKAVGELLSISPRQVWKLSACGTLPAPQAIPGTRSRRWKLNEVRDAIARWK